MRLNLYCDDKKQFYHTTEKNEAYELRQQDFVKVVN